MNPIPTSTLTTLDTGNNCKRGSIRSRESKEVQKPGLFAGRESVSLSNCGLKTPPLNPTHLSPSHKEVFPVSKGPRLGRLWLIPVRLLRSQRPSGSRLGCFWRRNCRMINKDTTIRSSLSCTCPPAASVSKLLRHRSTGHSSCKDKLGVKCKEEGATCILEEEQSEERCADLDLSSSPTSSSPASSDLWTAPAKYNSSSPRVDTAPWVMSRALLTWLGNRKQVVTAQPLPPLSLQTAHVCGFPGFQEEKPWKEENSQQFQKPKFRNLSVIKGTPGEVCGTFPTGLCYLQMM